MITLRDIESAVTEVFRLRPKEIHTNSRYRRIVRPRQVAMMLGVEMTGKGLKGAGRYWGKDHTTVLHAVRAIPVICQANPAFGGYVELCRVRLAHKGSWMAAVKRGIGPVEETHSSDTSFNPPQGPEPSRRLFVP